MKIFLGILLFIIFLGTISLSTWYVPYRINRLLGVKKRRLLHIAFAVMVVLSLISVMAFPPSTSSLLGFLYTLGGWLFMGHIYLTFSLLLLDVLRLFVPVPDRPGAATAIGIAVILVIYAAFMAIPFQVNKIDVPISGLSKDVTIMHISDAHIGHHRGSGYLEKIVDETNRHEPDIVLLNGDLVDSNVALEQGELTPLALLKAPAYFTTGNHESYVDTELALDIIESQGVRILHNEMVETHGIQLIGLDYMNADENTFDMHAVNKLTIKEELPKIQIDKNKPVIVMHHSPVGLEYVKEKGAAFMVSGHTHAGQIFPGTVFNPFIFPINKGLHKKGATQFFVSQGAGTYGMRMRLGTSNEIDLITLKAAH